MQSPRRRRSRLRGRLVELLGRTSRRLSSGAKRLRKTWCRPCGTRLLSTGTPGLRPGLMNIAPAGLECDDALRVFAREHGSGLILKPAVFVMSLTAWLKTYPSPNLTTAFL